MIVPFSSSYKAWARELLETRWGSCQVVSRGRIHEVLDLDGFICLVDDKPVGFLSFSIQETDLEIVTLDSCLPMCGHGRNLVARAVKEAEARGCKRVWLITTNDNTEALCFYQKIGFHLVAVYPDQVKTSRKLKPEIPELGLHGIPIRDEIELERSVP